MASKSAPFPQRPPRPQGSEVSQADTSQSGPAFSLRGLTMTPASFAMLALLLLGLLLCVQWLVVVAATYSLAGDTSGRSFDRGWALMSLLAIAWAVLNVYWSAQAAKSPSRSERAPAMLGHFAIAIGCGLIVVGIHAVSASRILANKPIVLDYSGHQRTGDSVDPVAPQLAVGDAEEGRKVFSTTCITCHGPSGGGLPNLAPSLRGSSFIASADDAAIANVIRLGRAATDPANKTKKVMPARGGNPFLGDDKITHLVAFVRAIQTESPTASASDPNAPPPVQLAAWVLPDAAPAPAGLVSLAEREDLGNDSALHRRDQDRKAIWVNAMTLSMTGIHGLVVLSVMVLSSHVLINGIREKQDGQDRSTWTWSSLGWIVASIVWLVVFLFGFVMV